MKTLNYIFLSLLIMTTLTMLNSCGDPEDDILRGDWIEIGDFGGDGLCDASTFVIGEKGYLIGGFDGDDYLNNLWVHNSENGTWTQLSALPGTARCNGTAFSTGDMGYFGLGYDGTNYLKDFWQFNPATNTWTQKSDFSGTARKGAISFAIGSKGYTGTGDNGTTLKDFYMFDAATNSWTQIEDLPGNPRSNGTAFTYNGMAYIVGGVNNNSYPYDFWKFNSTDQTWIKLNDISNTTTNKFDDSYTDIAREYPLSFVIGDKAYISTGNTSSSLTGNSSPLIVTTWEYDIAGDRWYRMVDFEGHARTSAACFSFGEKGIVLTGRVLSYRLDDMWEFLPDVILLPEK